MIRVLLVDDEPLARKRMSHLLSPYSDFEIVAEAESGAEAIAKANEHRPDLILLDISLPDMTGFRVLEQLTDRDSVAVMFVTAYDEHALAAFEARAFDYLLKPVAADRFEAAIERARKLVAVKPERYARRFLVERGSESSVFVSVDAIDWFGPLETMWCYTQAARLASCVPRSSPSNGGWTPSNSRESIAARSSMSTALASCTRGRMASTASA